MLTVPPEVQKEIDAREEASKVERVSAQRSAQEEKMSGRRERIQVKDEGVPSAEYVLIL